MVLPFDFHMYNSSGHGVLDFFCELREEGNEVKRVVGSKFGA